MLPPLLRRESEKELRTRGLDSVINDYHRPEIVRLRKAIDKARATGVYRRRSLAEYRKSLHEHRRGLTRRVFERQAWAATASPTTERRLRWIWAVERLRREIEERWENARRQEARVTEYEAAIAEQRYKPATLKAYARAVQNNRRYRDQALRELQELSEVLVDPYHSWRRRSAAEDPFLDGADAWLRRQLDGLGKEPTS
jgi:hypothetical protein